MFLHFPSPLTRVAIKPLEVIKLADVDLLTSGYVLDCSQLTTRNLVNSIIFAKIKSTLCSTALRAQEWLTRVKFRCKAFHLL